MMLFAEMLHYLQENDYRIAVGSKRVDYADAAARSLFAEGRTTSNATIYKMTVLLPVVRTAT